MFYKNLIVFCLLVPLVVFTKPQKAGELEIQKPTLEQHIERIFGKNAKVAMATLKAESGLQLDAKGWNCWYYTKDGRRYSRSCAKGDRGRAWSVDCGLGQINIKGKVCPQELLTLEGSMKQVEKKYKSEGLKAWVAYTSGSYRKYMQG